MLGSNGRDYLHTYGGYIHSTLAFGIEKNGALSNIMNQFYADDQYVSTPCEVNAEGGDSNTSVPTNRLQLRPRPKAWLACLFGLKWESRSLLTLLLANCLACSLHLRWRSS
jgi:hypothetical protein